MALEIPEKLAREEWEKLPDNQKPIYKQSESDPSVYEYGVPTMFNSMRNAKAEREAERKAREAAEARANAWSKFGDPSKVEDLLQRESLIRDGTKTLEEQIMKANRDAEEKYRGMVEESRKRVERLESERRADHEANIVRALIANSGVEKEYEDEVMLSFRRQLKTELRDGRPVTYVVDANNPNELAKDPDTFDPLTPERAFQIYRQKKSKFFKGDTGEQSGSGFSQARGGQADSFDGDPLEWSFATKRAFFDSMGGPNSPNAKAAYDKKLQAWTTKRQQKKAS